MSDEFVMDFPEEEEMQSSGGDYVTEPGTYHMLIDEVKFNHAGKKPYPGAITIAAKVLAGTVPNQAGRIQNLTLFPAKIDSKDQGAFARRKMAAAFIACNAADPSMFGKQAKIDTNAMQHAQFVCTLEAKKDENGQPSKYLDLHYSDIWHVDDPRAADYPKDTEAIALIPQQFRHGESWFAPLTAKKGSSQGNGSQQGKASTATAQSAASTNIDDLI